ncbi:SDR family oxidoreductase [Roseiterribacter gracilis]|uniref:3-oxoacyl-ACP reductase n=1 Tax=Roseiterribacter gracilis TaxID=2812848 RepID=A0A8S8XCF6_9PROT|nr:3-oxoacyl-ACP reductase [Rhodospirillales bacterium TMPK1]
MDLGLKGKTALVLGGSSGLGAAVATALSREGANVAVASRDKDKLAKTIATFAGEGLALQWDLADLSVIDANVAAVEKKFGQVDILVNNTGGPPPTAAAGADIDVWRKQMDAMVLSLIATTDRVLPGMRARKWGRIITSTSSGIVAPIPNLAISNALRLALVGWSKTLAREVAADGITCNIVLPGRISTERLGVLDSAKAKREGKTVEEVAKASLATIPAGRFGEPDEYGDVVAFLASTRAAYITGSTIRVDGGLIASI